MPPTKRNATNQLFIATLVEAVAYTALWLWNEYVAFYITIIFPALILVVLVMALIADWIEPSRIPGWYYKVMLLSVAIPVVIGMVFYFIYEGNFDFLSNQ